MEEYKRIIEIMVKVFDGRYQTKVEMQAYMDCVSLYIENCTDDAREELYLHQHLTMLLSKLV